MKQKLKNSSLWPFLCGILLAIFAYESAPKLLRAAVGEENASLMAIKADTIAIIAKLKEAVETYNKIATDTNKILDTAKESYTLAHKIANYNETIEAQKRAFKDFSDKFYAVSKDPLNHRIPLIYPGSQPLIAQTSDILSRLDRLSKTETIGKLEYANSTRSEAGETLGKIAAKDVRQKVNDLKILTGRKGDLNNHSQAELFGKEAAPINTDILLLVLESNIRQEELLARMAISMESGKPRGADPISKEKFNQSLKNYQDGKGTLLEND